MFISRLVSTREFPGFSTILNFSFLVSISRLVSFLEIPGKMDVFWHENVKSEEFSKKNVWNILPRETPKIITPKNPKKMKIVWKLRIFLVYLFYATRNFREDETRNFSKNKFLVSRFSDSWRDEKKRNTSR